MTERRHGGRLEGGGPDLVDFSSNVNAFGPPPAVLEALSGDVSRLVSEYPDPGYPSLKAALSAHTGRATEEIFPSNGSVENFFVTCWALRPRRVTVVAPCFCEYAVAAEAAGATIAEFHLRPEDGFALDVDAAGGAAAGSDLVFFCNPNSPTGAAYSRGEVLDLASRLDPGSLLLVDEAFMEFCEDAGSRSVVGEVGERIWVSCSLTKFYSLAGLRAGFLVAPAEAVARLERSAPPWRVNRLAEAASIAALGDTTFAEETRSQTAEARRRFAALLDGTGFLKVYPSETNFVLVETTTGDLTAPELKERLLRRGFLVRDASSFPGLDERFLRFAVRGDEDNEALVEALTDTNRPNATKVTGTVVAFCNKGDRHCCCIDTEDPATPGEDG